MKNVFILLLLGLLSGCGNDSDKYIKPNGDLYPYVLVVRNVEIQKDNKWYTNGDAKLTSYIACDSFQMVTTTECIFWSEGNKMNIKANLTITPTSTFK